MPRSKAKLTTGNVFADIGTPNTEEHALKADVVIKIGMLIESKKLSQTQTAKLTGISQPDLSRLLRDLLPNLPPFISRLCSSFAPGRSVLRTQLV
jgi:predicted XRE-type DNA-binding protein